MELSITERDAQHKLVVDGFLQYCENLGARVGQQYCNSYEWGAVFTCFVRGDPVSISHRNGQITASYNRKSRSVSQLKGWVDRKSVV